MKQPLPDPSGNLASPGRFWAWIGLLITGLLLVKGEETHGAEPLGVGDTVRVAARTGLNVRDSPNGNTLGKQPNNAQGVISAGPRRAAGSETWWQIDWRDGIDGWCAQSFLVRVGTIAVRAASPMPPAPASSTAEPMPVRMPEDRAQQSAELAMTVASLQTEVRSLVSQTAELAVGLADLRTRQNSGRVDPDRLATPGGETSRLPDRTGTWLGAVALALGIWAVWRAGRGPSSDILLDLQGEITRVQKDLKKLSTDLYDRTSRPRGDPTPPVALAARPGSKTAETRAPEIQVAAPAASVPSGESAAVMEGDTESDVRVESPAAEPATVVPTLTPVPPLEPGPRERIGTCFTSFCREHTKEFPREAFQASLKRVVPEATLGERPIFQPTSDAAVSFLDRPEGSARRAWRVTALGVDYLLPHPIGGPEARFETTDGFLVEAGERQPANLLECLPAVLRRQGNAWEIQEPGKLA